MATATNFDRLLKLGQQKGGLTTDDLVRVLPIEAMTVEEIASLITRLEGANVPVEVDPALLSPMHRATLRLKLKPHPVGLKRREMGLMRHPRLGLLPVASLGRPRTIAGEQDLTRARKCS